MEEDEDDGKEEERTEKEERNESGSSPKHRLSLQDLLYLQKLHDTERCACPQPAAFLSPRTHVMSSTLCVKDLSYLLWLQVSSRLVIKNSV